MREVVSGTGSRFLLCTLSQRDRRYPKYPAQPVLECPGYQPRLTLKLELLPDTFAVCRLGPTEAVPAWAAGPFVSTTRSADELSIVCAESAVPADTHREGGWRCLRVAGTIDFATVGVVASLTAPLASARISVFVVSTFDTDYLLVKQADLAEAVVALRAAGMEA